MKERNGIGMWMRDSKEQSVAMINKKKKKNQKTNARISLLKTFNDHCKKKKKRLKNHPFFKWYN